MVAQLNRFMTLFVLFWLLTRPAIATPDSYQTLVVNGDTLVVQMAEPLLADALPLAASDDSLSIQKGVMRAEEAEKIGSAQAPLAASNSTERTKRKRTVDQLALFGISVIGGTLIGAELGPVILKEPEDCPDGSFFKCDLRDIEGGLLGFLAGLYIGIILASDSPDQAGTPSKPDESRRFSIGLRPDTRGRLSAVATLRF
ncbi:MAG: hypothetical protein F4Y91_15205 [Gemmatimonadetes bacterium]|nr:hypothetical protein [Gemmatimonadota bacterium]MYB67846.1 hypothetical protein [Gemmatimonadota bacterium]